MPQPTELDNLRSIFSRAAIPYSESSITAEYIEEYKLPENAARELSVGPAMRHASGNLVWTEPQEKPFGPPIYGDSWAGVEYYFDDKGKLLGLGLSSGN